MGGPPAYHLDGVTARQSVLKSHFSPFPRQPAISATRAEFQPQADQLGTDLKWQIIILCGYDRGYGARRQGQVRDDVEI